MNDRIRTAMDQVRAGDQLKSRTLSMMREQISAGEPRPLRSRRHGLRLALALCGLMLAVGLFGGWLYLWPVSAISIDVNPSLELAVNRFDLVVGVDGFNEGGRELADTLPVRNMDYASAVQLIISDQRVQDYLNSGEAVSILVACGDEEKGRQMLAAVEGCVGQQKNVHCHASGTEGHHAAHEAQLSYGKYLLYASIRELDPEFSSEQAADMTVSQLRELLRSLEGSGGQEPSGTASPTGTAAPEGGTENSQGHGSGGAHHRHRHGQS